MKLNDKQKIIVAALIFLAVLGGLGALNYMKYSNPAVDAAIQQLVTSADKKVIEKADHTIIENVLKDVPIIWVSRFQAFTAYNKTAVHNWKMYFELRPFLDGLWLSKPKG